MDTRRVRASTKTVHAGDCFVVRRTAFPDGRRLRDSQTARECPYAHGGRIERALLLTISVALHTCCRPRERSRAAAPPLVPNRGNVRWRGAQPNSMVGTGMPWEYRKRPPALPR